VSASAPGAVTPAVQGDGRMKLSFAGMSGLKLSYSVMGTTNIALPYTNWLAAGGATDSVATPGQFQFTDSQSTNLPQRFYRAQWP